MYNLIEYSEKFSKTSGSLYQYYRDEPVVNDNDNIIYSPNDKNNNILSKFKQQTTRQTENNVTKDVEIIVPLKYFSNFRRMPLINYKSSLTLTWSKNRFLVACTAANQETTITITDTKLYILVVTLSNQNDIKLLKQLESGFKRKIIGININKKTEQAQNI